MKIRFLVAGDLDGFFGLFIDNLLQLMLIVVLGSSVAGLPQDFITHRILPGAAFSILAGNLFYSWQALRLARRSGRTDVTALPYGINTPSLVAFIFLIMGPIYQETHNPTLVWQIGLFACLLSGLMETGGAFFGDWLRRHTPRAALLSSLAGVALTFIAMGFIFQIFSIPALAIIPMLFLLAVYGGKIRLPGGLPGGLVAVVLGSLIAWGLRAFGLYYFEASTQATPLAFHPPYPFPQDLISVLKSPWGWKHMAIIFPMALFNLIGSLQNLDSAEAAGDRYETKPSLIANGLCSVLAAFLGSAFPTTIYIGHPAWKGMGARIGYSVLNGSVIALLCLFGGVTWVLQLVPLEVTLGILLWIGVVMTAQAFQEVPKNHALAVAVGLIPALAAWALVLVETTVRKAGGDLFTVAPKFGSELYINGLIALSQGFLLSSMLLASVMVFILEKDFFKAALWLGASALLSLLGVIHAFQLTPSGIQNHFGLWAAPEFALAYGASALLFLLLHRWTKHKLSSNRFIA